MRAPLYLGRRAGGRDLASLLEARLDGRDPVVVLGLARGGVPVADEVAQRLRSPLDVLIVRKVGLPWQPELAMGAVATGGTVIRNDTVLRRVAFAERVFAQALELEQRELLRREAMYLGDRKPLDVAGHTVILVDDGIATGSTMRAAIGSLRQRGARRILVAVPHGAADTCEELASIADDCVCCHRPEPYVAVGAWYDDFPQVSDGEVQEILARYREVKSRPSPATDSASA